MVLKGVSVIIPAFNEAGKIQATVSSVALIPEVKEIVVVDDASTDATPEMARAAGARVFSMPQNNGKGAALTYGATRVKSDVIALLDGDLGNSAGEARLLILPVLEGTADMTIAGFPPARKKGGFGLVKGLAAQGIYKHTGLKVKSPLSGQRVMTREVMEKVLPFASGYGVEVAMTIKVAKLGFRIMEVPVIMFHAETGRDLKGFMHRGKQFVDILRVLTRLRMKGA